MGPLIIADIAIGSVCVTVALLHLTIFLRRQDLKANLFFAIMSLCAAGSALSELWVYRATTLEVFNSAFRVQITFQAFLWMALIWFIAYYTGTARRWLAIALTAAYGLALIINIIYPSGVIYSEITALHSFTLPWGEQITYATGTLNPWRFIADIAWVFLLFLVTESCLRLYRHGEKRRAITLSASVFVFLVIAYLHGTLMDLGIVGPPGIVSFSFLGLVLVMSGFLSAELVRASVLSREVLANERRWRSLLENVQLLILGVDRNGRIIYVNPHFINVTGFSAQDVLGRSIAELVPEEDREDLLVRYREAMEGNIRPHGQRTLLMKDGRQRQIAWSNVILRDPNGEIKGTLSVGEDITDLERAEQELRDEKERRDVILSSLNTGLVLIDPDMTVIWANEQLQKMFPNCIGKKCYAVAENRTTPCEGCQSVLSFSDGAIHEREFVNSLDGRWYHVVALPIKDVTGRVISVLEATTDINERKLTEEALRESEAKHRIVADNTYDWEFWLNSQGEFVYISPSCKRITGYSREELSSDPDLGTRLIHPDDRDGFEAHRREVEEQRNAEECEFRIVRKDGEVRWMSHACQPVFDEEGRYLGVRGSNRDITGRKEAEEARDQAMKELEALKSRLEEENIYLKTEIQEVRFFSKIVGKSNPLLYVLARVNEVAETDATVLIQGETGVGKELVARAVHEASRRAEKPFITVNCAALPHNLVESELFGHERGSFTGAERLRKGRFEVADGGTLFLDEISELPLGVQAKLLRVLQDGEFERVGGSQTLKADVRVIAATNRNLGEEVADDRFRPDLYYRLNVYPITVPPLRKRREDIPILVDHFIPQIASRIGKHINQIPTRMMERLMAYHWPGNVRELRNVLERAVITSPGSVLQIPEGFEFGASRTPSETPEEWHSLEETERRYILKVLERTEGRIEGPGGAAELLQVRPSTLRYRLQKLGIRRKKIAERSDV